MIHSRRVKSSVDDVAQDKPGRRNSKHDYIPRSGFKVRTTPTAAGETGQSLNLDCEYMYRDLDTFLVL